MPLTNAGRNFIAASIIQDGPPTPFNNANAHIGVGDSSTAFAATQTDLQASTNKVRVGMDTGYPIINVNVLGFQATFGTSVGNFTWNEWATFNASTAGVMFNRKVENNGTKTPGQIWVFSTQLTILIGS
jgi:hypothetical protein